jgi:hypothetical protein
MDGEFYDIIIDIDSFDGLKSSGWNIIYSDNGKNYLDFLEQNKQNENTYLNRIGILGASGVGKTFILGKLINKAELYESKIETKGISLIYPKTTGEKKDENNLNLFVCIDSQGSQEPIKDIKNTPETIFNYDDKKRKDLVKLSSKDKNLIETFIQDFIIENSNILIVVVDQLTFSEQKLINKLSTKHFDKLFVIHNTQFFKKKKTIQKHIENVVTKSVFFNLKRRNIPDLEKTKNDNNNKDDFNRYYYYENGIGNYNNKNKRKEEIIHLFMGREKSEAGKYYNNQTIKFIRYLIKAETVKRQFNIIKEIKQFLSFNSIQYMIKENEKERPIEPDDLEEISNEDSNYLKCNCDFKLKDCIINEMGLCNFSSQNSITPAFICYKGEYSHKKKKNDKNGGEEKEEKWPALIVEAEMFVEPKKNPIKVSQYLNEEGDSMILTITCNKKFVKDDDIEEIETLEGDIKEGLINITIKINLENLVPDPSKKYIVKASEPGIITVYIKIIDDKKQTNFTSKIISKGKVTTK